MDKDEIIFKEIHHGNQSVDYTEIIELTEDNNVNKLKITVKSDSYEHQSYARIYLFKDGDWNFIERIGYSQMKTQHQLKCVKEEITDKHFEADRNKLLVIAVKLLY